MRWRCCLPEREGAGSGLFRWVDVLAFALAFVTGIFLFVLVFCYVPPFKFFFVDGFDKAEAEVKFAFAGTCRAGDKEVHIRIDGLTEVDCLHRQQG